jgi:hypothetical protein
MLKVSEVYEKQVRQHQERPDGTEFVNYVRTLDTRESLINLDYIVSLTPYEFGSNVGLETIERTFPAGTEFSTLVLDGNSFRKSEIIVVGSFEKFCQRLENRQS